MRNAFRACRRPLMALAVLLSVVPLAACGADEPVLTDVDVVFCLSDEQRAALADAAVTLGLARSAPDEDVKVGGRRMTLGEWRVARPEAFTQACFAIRPERPAANSTGFPPAVLTWLLTLVTAVVAAVLGFTSAYLLQKSARAGQNGRLLRSAITAFVTAARAYARDWESGGPEQPSDLAVQDRRAALMTELRMMAAAYPESPASGAVQTLSTTLSERTFRQWPQQDHDGVEEELTALETSVTALADMLEHPWRDRDKLTGKVAAAAGGGA